MTKNQRVTSLSRCVPKILSLQKMTKFDLTPNVWIPVMHIFLMMYNTIGIPDICHRHHKHCLWRKIRRRKNKFLHFVDLLSYTPNDNHFRHVEQTKIMNDIDMFSKCAQSKRFTCLFKIEIGNAQKPTYMTTEAQILITIGKKD